MKTFFNTKITKLASGVAMAAALAACGGGSGSSNSATSGTSNPPPVATSMSGTVAVGDALPNVAVTVTDGNGKTVKATTDANGNYNASITGLTVPFIVTAYDQSNNLMYSVVANAASVSGAPVTANVTPLTTAVAALMTQSGNPSDLAGNLSAITNSAISSAVAKLDQAIAPILAANQVAATFDPVGTTFTANQTGADAVIDSVSVTPSTTGTGLQIASSADPSVAITLNASTTVSTALQNPPQPANYLANLQGALTECLTDTKSASNGNIANISTLASTSACNSAIDSKYENDSYSGFEYVRQDIVFGTPIGNKTIRFIPANTLNNNANPEALVEFTFVNVNGKLTFVDDIVQQLPNGNWDIIGDQNSAILNVTSFVGKMQYTDSADANSGHYESGLELLLGTNGYKAVVTGPGLPTSGVTLYSAGSGTGSYFTFLDNATVTTNANGGPNSGMNTQYKWTWSGGSFAPSATDPSYAPSQVDVSTIQQYGIYTATFYDNAGNTLGTYQTINTTPNANSASGSSISWPQLTTDTIANLLTPGGAAATTATKGCAAQCSTTVSWTDSANVMTEQLYNWATISSLGAVGLVNGVNTVQPYAANWDQFLPVTNGSTNSLVMTGYVDQLTSGGASISAEAAAQVQLGWQNANGFYTNTWQYKAQ